MEYKDFSLDIGKYSKLEEYSGTSAFVLSVRNILLSRPGNFYRSPSIGIDIEQYMYDFADITTQKTIQQKINDQISKYVENVGNLSVVVEVKNNVEIGERTKDIIMISISASVDTESVTANFIAFEDYNNLNIYNETY